MQKVRLAEDAWSTRDLYTQRNVTVCGRGEIGRRTALRWLRGQPRGGSSPLYNRAWFGVDQLDDWILPEVADCVDRAISLSDSENVGRLHAQCVRENYPYHAPMSHERNGLSGVARAQIPCGRNHAGIHFRKAFA